LSTARRDIWINVWKRLDILAAKHNNRLRGFVDVFEQAMNDAKDSKV